MKHPLQNVYLKSYKAYIMCAWKNLLQFMNLLYFILIRRFFVVYQSFHICNDVTSLFKPLKMWQGCIQFFNIVAASLAAIYMYISSPVERTTCSVIKSPIWKYPIPKKRQHAKTYFTNKFVFKSENIILQYNRWRCVFYEVATLEYIT